MTLVSSSVNISTPVKNSENTRIKGPEHVEILLGLQIHLATTDIFIYIYNKLYSNHFTHRHNTCIFILG
ncbi:hypothetical protein K439DRAFT_1069163 [Ramaria rubella]|nr:hypothetical protein K439DRAFT_1069163 [Ramaria rubella]